MCIHTCIHTYIPVYSVRPSKTSSHRPVLVQRKRKKKGGSKKYDPARTCTSTSTRITCTQRSLNSLCPIIQQVRMTQENGQKRRRRMEKEKEKERKKRPNKQTLLNGLFVPFSRLPSHVGARPPYIQNRGRKEGSCEPRTRHVFFCAIP